jgi:hypothetical protein
MSVNCDTSLNPVESPCNPDQPCCRSCRPYCRSCGRLLKDRRRKSCKTAACQDAFIWALECVSSILKRLPVKGARVFFSDTDVILDMVLSEPAVVKRRSILRGLNERPADTLSRWYEEMNTILAGNKTPAPNQTAAEAVLAQAADLDINPNLIMPRPLSRQTTKLLRVLGLTWESFQTCSRAADFREVIHAAYLQQARFHHPDVGGKSKNFKTLNNCYDHLKDSVDDLKDSVAAGVASTQKSLGLPGAWCLRIEGSSYEWLLPV